MADSVVRLRIDSSEYDHKLRNATTALNRFFDSARQGGQSIANADKSVEDAVRSFGNMAAKAQDSRGKLNEMTRAFTEMSMQYKQLTDAEKQSPVGQAMATSLDQLKGRINETKTQLAEVNKELGNTKNEGNATGGVLEQLAGKFGMSVKGAGMLGAALAAGQVAMEAFDKTMQATEGTADLLASVQMQLNSVVDGFFRSINEGNFNNFLSGLSDIANRAREAYEAMDELSSYAVRYNPKNQSDMREIDKLLKEARALQAKGDKAGAAAKTAAATRIANQARQNTIAYGEAEYQSGVSTLRSLLGGTGVNFTNRQIEWYSDPKNWDRIKQKASEYKAIQAQIDKLNRSSITTTSYDTQTRTKNLERIRQLEASITDEQRRAFTYLNTRDTAGTEEGDMFIRATQQIYGRKNAEFAADAIQARIDRADAMANRPTGGGTGGGGKTSGGSSDVITKIIPVEDLKIASVGVVTSMKDLKARLSRYTAMLDTATTTGEYKTATQGIADTKKAMSLQPIALKMGWSIEDTAAFQEQLDEMAKNIQPVQIPAELKVDGSATTTAKETAEGWKSAADAVNQVSGALAGLEDPSAKIAGIVGQAIANIALGFATATAKDTKFGVFGWIAAIAGGLATMISTISAIKSATAGSYAQGGIVPGNSYSGDRLTANVNSGELILNAAQQNNIASLLQGGGMSNMHLEAVVSGEQLRFVLNNNSRRRSRGEYVTTLMRN